MRITTRVTARENNQYNNTISMGNTGEGYFLYFRTIEYNSIKELRKEYNPLLSLLPEFRRDLKGDIIHHQEKSKRIKF